MDFQPRRDSYSQQFDQRRLPTLHIFFTEVLCPSQAPSVDEIMQEPLVNPQQKIIKADCMRTRSQFFTVDLQEQLEHLLTHYCRRQQLSYRQGMHEVAAPFVYLTRGGACLGQCSALFHAFLSKYCLNFYQDQNFGPLVLFLRMFLIVLKYHDPSVHRYLQWHDVEPQLFCFSWLMTLFASHLSLTHTYQLWGHLALEGDPYLLFFLVLAVVLGNRDNILEQRSVHILKVMTDLVFKDDEELKSVLERALLLRKETPTSLVMLLRSRAVFESRGWEHRDFSELDRLIKHITEINLFLVLPSELFLGAHTGRGTCPQGCHSCDLHKPIKPLSQVPAGLTRDLIKTANQLRRTHYRREYVLVDLRKSKQQELGPQWEVFAVDPEEEAGEVEQRFISRFLEEKYCKHFVLLLTRFSFEAVEDCDKIELQACKELLQRLTSMSFPLLSMLEGGYVGLQGCGASTSHSCTQSQPAAEDQSEERITRIPFEWELTIGDRLRMGECLRRRDMVHEEGPTDTVIVTQFLVLICRSSQELRHFLNYFQHSSSLMQYLHQRLHAPGCLGVKRVIPLHLLRKASVKIHQQHILVISYESCRHFEAQPSFRHPQELFTMHIDSYLTMLQQCEDCVGARRKAIIELEEPEAVKQCSATLAKRYVQLRKTMDGLEESGSQRISQSNASNNIDRQQKIDND